MGVKISSVTYRYLLSHLLKVAVKKDMLDSVASLILNLYVALGLVIGTEDYADNTQVKPSSDQLNSIKKILNSSLESQYDDREFGVILEPKLSAHYLTSFQCDGQQERKIA